MATSIRVLSTIGMRTVLEDIAPAFERQNGCTVERHYNSSVAHMQRIAEGKSGDAAVFTAAAIDDLIAQGKVESRIDLAHSGIGIAVRRGAPQPDISTPEKFTEALLAAKSVAHSKTGASGLYFVHLIERLGIAEAIRAKAVVHDGLTGEIAARGEAELAVQQVSELMQAAGVDIVGALPAELQNVTVFSAGVFKGSTEAQLAGAFVAALAAPASADVIRRNGMDPA
jgi:molybdate transport system substrate-binding protein